MSDDVSIARTLAGIYGNNDTDFETRICNGASAMSAVARQGIKQAVLR